MSLVLNNWAQVNTSIYLDLSVRFLIDVGKPGFLGNFHVSCFHLVVIPMKYRDDTEMAELLPLIVYPFP